MARLIRIAQTRLRNCSSCSPKTLINRHPNPPLLRWHSMPYTSEALPTSPLTSNILRILRTEIEYQSDSAPPHQPPTKFNSFAVEDRPGEQWITMRGKFGDSEDIKIEVTMFDGYESVPKTGDESSGEDLRLHISVLVDISKGDGSNDLEFLCSAWPDSLEIQKVYVLHRGRMPAKPYLGPDFRDVNEEIQKKLRGYLEARGVNDELSLFLHQYMMNKDRIELIRWLGNLKLAVEK
ncbi:PREDICTED: uncharacterized protein At2g39795, mitochondrial [Fragaria vesca subsp. vesca]|uniref:uncharacterized protein At2g39795, mitochondrial n=1 Tax=Fragaria vesca subsp. vesca TaxID=101020 RepID=UPI0002C34AAE|nr:PREDICTED: uncharacterized protein At2g39795, mitochondrial [Fragaria vesca subsp. vesca]